MSEKLNDIFATYVDAIEKFSECSKAFLQHVDLLNRARSEYEKAATASRELRSVLETGDETLRTLMTQMESAINAPLAEPDLEEKKAERTAAKTETIKASSASAAAGSSSGSSSAKTFP
jgi:hypothetical protein